MRRFWITQSALFTAAAFMSFNGYGEPVSVRHQQGSAHGFLVLKDLAGAQLATGDVIQVAHGDRVTSHVTLRFRDGSLDDDTTVFSQRGTFRLVSDHHIQHGPSFPEAFDVSIDAKTGQITSRSVDGKSEVENLALPDDVSNGLPPNLLLNILPATPETRISYVTPTSKPRLIHISIRPGGDLNFSIAGTPRKATDFILHVELGGIAGIVAPILGKQPKDFHIYIMQGRMPAFIREEGQFYLGGPIWRIELVSPEFH